MAKPRKSVPKDTTGSTPTPDIAPAPTKGGRTRVYTSKQKENAVIQQNEKEDAAKKRAYVAALRAHQAEEEALGFVTSNTIAQDNNNDEDDYEEEDTWFSAVTMPPIKTTSRNGRTLVHRVPPKEYQPSAVIGTPTPPVPQGQLVRRVTSTSTGAIVTPSNPTQLVRRVTTPGTTTKPILSVGLGQLVQYSMHQDPVPLDEDDYLEVRSSTPDLDTVPGSKVRKSPPSSASAETTTIIKSARNGPSGTRNRFRVADFDLFTKDMLEDAISYYKAYINTKKLFPDPSEDRDSSTAAFVKACADRNVQVELEEDHLKVITSRASQARGHIKSTAKGFVETLYELGTHNGKRTNRNKVERLLEHLNFLYKAEYSLNPIERTGLYLHPIIQTIINKCWFRNSSDEGVMYPEYSEGGRISLSMIASVLTVVQCCLDEWVTGEFQPVSFAAIKYKAIYEQHLQRLEDFGAKTSDMNILPRLCKHLLNNARKHAKVSITSEMAPIQLEATDIEAAKKEWESIVLSDGEDYIDNDL